MSARDDFGKKNGGNGGEEKPLNATELDQIALLCRNDAFMTAICYRAYIEKNVSAEEFRQAIANRDPSLMNQLLMEMRQEQPAFLMRGHH